MAATTIDEELAQREIGRADRRRNPRLRLACPVEVLEPSTHWAGTVRNISLGGALIEPAGGSLPRGDFRVAIIFSHTYQVLLRAQVIAVRPGDGEKRLVAVAFIELDPKERAVLGLTLRAGVKLSMRTWGPAVLVVDASEGIRSSLREVLNSLGARATGVATPLEAIARITHAAPPVDAAFLGVPAGSASGQDLLQFLAAQHPAVRTIALVNNRQDAPPGTPGSEADRSPATLARPWTAARLALAIASRGDCRRPNDLTESRNRGQLTSPIENEL